MTSDGVSDATKRLVARHFSIDSVRHSREFYTVETRGA